MKTPRSTKAEQSAAEQGSVMVPDTAGAIKMTGNKPGTAPLVLVATKTEPRVDSRLLAKQLGIKHPNLFAQVKTHKTDFEEFGKVTFQTGALPSGQSEKFATLNEDQAYLLLTYSRNTAKVRALKVKLVKAFAQAHRLHDAINRALLRAWCATPSGWGRGKVRPGAEHTKSEAADLPDSEVFSRPEFMVLGVGNRYPQGRGHRFGGVFKPHVHPADLNNRRMVFATPEGVKAMSTSPLASRSAAPTITPTTGNTTPDLVQLHLQACNALAQALHTLRNSDCSASDLHRAISRTMRAGTALKRMALEVTP